MAEKRKGGNTVNAVWELAEPIAKSLGLILWDVNFQKEGAAYYLRVIIDKEGGVGIDDCVAMNDALDTPLDELDPIDGSYNLQISSAGIERELIRDFHFEKFMGARCILKLRSAYKEQKLHKCILSGYDAKSRDITVTFNDGEQQSFTKTQVQSIKLDDFDTVL